VMSVTDLEIDEAIREAWTGRPKRAAIYGSVLDAMSTPRWLAAWSRITVQR
jgi:hypothetical protein